MCKDNGLKSSGKKVDLINYLLNPYQYKKKKKIPLAKKEEKEENIDQIISDLFE